MSIVFLFFLKKFGEGFLIGCIIRIIVSLIFRFDFTIRGLIFSGTFIGIVIALLNYLFLITTYF